MDEEWGETLRARARAETQHSIQMKSLQLGFDHQIQGPGSDWSVAKGRCPSDSDMIHLNSMRNVVVLFIIPVCKHVYKQVFINRFLNGSGQTAGF
jgi:hypothetical protein